MRFYFYTNNTDFELYLVYGSLMPMVANCTNYYGSLGTINKKYIFLTHKNLSKECIDKYCRHRNIFGIRVKLELNNLDSCYLLLKDGSIISGSVSDYNADTMLGLFTDTVISLTNISDICSFENTIVNNMYSDCVYPFNLVSQSDEYGEDDIAIENVELPISKNNNSLFVNIKSAYLSLAINYKYSVDTIDSNVDEKMFNIVSNGESYEEFIKEKYPLITIPYTQGKSLDTIIFKNLDSMLKSAIDGLSINDYMDKIVSSDDTKANFALIYIYVKKLIENIDSNEVSIIVDKMIPDYVQYLDSINLSDNIKLFYQNVSALLSDSVSINEVIEAYTRTERKELYISIIILKILLCHSKIKDVEKCIEFYNLRFSIVRILYFLYGLTFGYGDLTSKYKGFDYYMLFSERKAQVILESNNSLCSLPTFVSRFNLEIQPVTDLYYPVIIVEKDLGKAVNIKLKELLNSTFASYSQGSEITNILLSLKRKKSDDEKLYSILVKPLPDKKKKKKTSKKSKESQKTGYVVQNLFGDDVNV